MKAGMDTLYFFSCRFNDLLSSKQSASLTLSGSNTYEGRSTLFSARIVVH